MVDVGPVILYNARRQCDDKVKNKVKKEKDLCKRTARRIGLARSSKGHNHHNSLLSSRDRNRLVYGANGQNKELPTFNFRREELYFPSLSRHRRTTNVNTSEWIVCASSILLFRRVYIPVYRFCPVYCLPTYYLPIAYCVKQPRRNN